jgi:hypothetical protein
MVCLLTRLSWSDLFRPVELSSKLESRCGCCVGMWTPRQPYPCHFLAKTLQAGEILTGAAEAVSAGGTLGRVIAEAMYRAEPGKS